MYERWIIAFEPERSGQGKYLYVRNEAGDIVIFPSRVSAQLWVLANQSLPETIGDIAYMKLPEKRA